MKIISDIFSSLSIILVIILISNHQLIKHLPKFIKIIILLLCVSVTGANLLNVLDFCSGVIRGYLSHI